MAGRCVRATFANPVVSKPRKPNFLVLGAQKSGTTYLCAELARHPDVFHAEPKELLFFQRPDVDDASFARYLKHFEGAGDRRWVGEGSAVYLQWPGAMRNIRRHLGRDLRLIVCLRQPTDRAVSFYLHNLRKGRFDGTERLASAGDGDVRLSPVVSSFYGKHLERWQNAYGDRLKVLLFDQLLESPEDFVKGATDHLGIDPLPAVKQTAVNRGFMLSWDGDCLTVDGPLPDGVKRPRFSRDELESLHAKFLPDIARTEAAIGRPLGHWNALPEFTAKQAAF